MNKDSIARVLATAFAASCCLGLAACEQDSDPIDDAADAIGDAADDAADTAEDMADDAGDAIDDMTDGN